MEADDTGGEYGVDFKVTIAKVYFGVEMQKLPALILLIVRLATNQSLHAMLGNR